MKHLSKVCSLFASLALFALGSLDAQAQVYYGYNPSSGIEVLHGAEVFGGPLPVLTGCATISVSVGGASGGRFQTSGTSCNLTITFPSAAPNGWACFATDITTAVVLRQASTTSTSCTFAAAVTTAADNIIWNAAGY